MTTITRDDVLHLASLSSLQLSDHEVDALQADLAGIVGYIDQLSALDTTGVEPTYQVTDLENVWREDEVDDYGLGGEALVELAPEATQNYVKVPKVL